MGRIDNFDEILDSYEGRKYESKGRCRNLCLIVDSGDSVSRETFQKIQKGARKAIAEVPDDGYCAIINFSSRCRVNGWMPKLELEKELSGLQLASVLDTYLGGISCALTADMIKKLLPENPDYPNTAVLLVTDNLNRFEGVPELFAELTAKGYFTGLAAFSLPGPDVFKQFSSVHTPKKEHITNAMENFANKAFNEK